MRRTALIFVTLLLSAGCGKPSLDGDWSGSSGQDGFSVDLRFSGGKVDIDFASKKTTAKLKATGTYKVDGETMKTTIDKATIDEASLTGNMKEITKTQGVKEATEKVVVDLLSKQLSGPYKLEGQTLRILGNPSDIVLTRKN